MKHYKSPWSTLLIVTSTLFTLLLAWVTFSGVVTGWMCWMLGAVVPISALFAIRGYTIVPDAILVHRLLWSTRLPRTDLQSAVFDPDATCNSVRTCGNGGLYSFSGRCWNKRLGSYRALITDTSLAVVLRYEDGSTIVISPAQPEEFVQELGSLPETK